jgi:AhpD family alkylhydroperoxidase
MLPKKLRARMFDSMSVKTMRYVSAVPTKAATGLVARIYEMIAEDFFINGSLTSHSKVPALLAGVWTGGRELVLVSDALDRTTKEALGATLSYINDCPYCADMLVSLVHGSGKHTAATRIAAEAEETIDDPVLRERLAWVRTVASDGPEHAGKTAFTAEQLPEAIGTLFAFHYINRVSHVLMDGSPVGKPFKNTALRLFGYELRETTERRIEPGRALEFLPAAPLPDDLAWTAPNPRVAAALARWAAVVEREAEGVVSPAVREVVQRSLAAWQGETMPLSRGWVNEELTGLSGEDRAVAKLALVVAKASFQVDDTLVEAVLGEARDEQRLIRLLAWASFSAARRLAAHIAGGLAAPQILPVASSACPGDTVTYGQHQEVRECA